MANGIWKPWQPSEAEPWDLRRVVHVHRRAGFAGTWGELQRDLQAGVDATLDRFLSGHVSGQPRDGFAETADVLADSAVASEDPARLVAWWLYRMLYTPDPLGERLTLMWHNHFATNVEKVGNLVFMREQNDLFRSLGRDAFPKLLTSVIKHPAILIWLDANTNRRGLANENLARELMELFVLGEGNYDETDVREAAKALTGWSVDRRGFAFADEEHERGPKRLFGTHKVQDGDELLALLTAQPAAARRIAWRLCHTFLGENVAGDAEIESLAQILRDNEWRIGAGVETILRSRLFFSDANIGNRVLGPAEYIVAAVRGLELLDPPPSTLLLGEWIARMEQTLFAPPNVFGWQEGRAWITSRTLIARANFATTLSRGELHLPRIEFDPRQLLERAEREATPAELERHLQLLFCGAERPSTENAPPHMPFTRELAVNIMARILGLPRAQLG